MPRPKLRRPGGPVEGKVGGVVKEDSREDGSGQTQIDRIELRGGHTFVYRKFYGDAEFNFNIVKKGNGVHNLDFAESLLEYANRRLDEALKQLAKSQEEISKGEIFLDEATDRAIMLRGSPVHDGDDADVNRAFRTSLAAEDRILYSMISRAQSRSKGDPLHRRICSIEKYYLTKGRNFL